LWEAKGTEVKADEVRRQVCGFANSHEGGYLILGAEEAKDGSWSLEGVCFRDEPPTWVTSVVGNGGVNPYPDGLDVKGWLTQDGRQVAVVYIPPISTPPCNVNGTVYERVSGKTITVREPLRLAELFARGDAAQKAGVSKAEQISARMVRQADVDSANAQFAFGLAAPGYPLDLTPRLFTSSFAEAARSRISAVLVGQDRYPIAPQVSSAVDQGGMSFQVRAGDRRLGYDWQVSVARAGAVGIHWTMDVQQTTVASVVNVGGPLDRAWRYADETLTFLGLKAPRYLQMVVGVPLPSANPARVGRGLVFGPDQDALASVSRELRRAAGEMIFEDDSE
jgi:hypothetical protein